MNEIVPNINQELLILSPSAPPGVCGVGDFSYSLAKEMAARLETVSIGVARKSKRNSPMDAFIAIEPWRQTVRKAIKRSVPTTIILNYTPSSFARTGLAKQLIDSLLMFKKANCNNKIYLLLHETWDGSPNLKIHHAIRDRFARYSISRILRLADGAAVATEKQRKKLQQISEGQDIWLFPVGANIIPDSPPNALSGARDPGTWVIFGLAHTRLWAIQRHFNFLNDQYRKGMLRKLLSIGPVNSKFGHEESLAVSSINSDLLTQLGVLEPHDISAELFKAGAAIVGQDADGLRKSGSFAALAAHGVSVICDVSVSLDEPPGTAIFRPSEIERNPDILSSEEGEWRRKQLYQWFWTTKSWNSIGAQVADWMEHKK